MPRISVYDNVDRNKALEFYAHHLSLSLAPAENDELLRTSPISSRQKLKLFIVHMYENFTTFTWQQKQGPVIKCNCN